jgi:MurNAc alpha-1-phosphate uridylyltransferase
MGRATAMILAAGRGERMRPLSDAVPKPLLEVAGEPLVVRQVEALARAGHRDVAINASHLAQKLVDALGDGHAHGVRLHWSIEPEPLEVAGGLATARPLLADGPVLVVSGDVWTAYDYGALEPVRPRISIARGRAAHLVMVPNPPYHEQGDFALENGTDHGPDGRRLLPRRTQALPGGAPNLTYGNIGLYDAALFDGLPRGVKLKLLPLLLDWIGRGWATGEYYSGPWANVGTPGDLAELNAALANRA